MTWIATRSSRAGAKSTISDDPVQAIRIEPAASSDAETLASISRRAFEHDVNYGAPGPGGPPGYDSPAWQRQMMKRGRFFKVLEADRVIGGFVLFRLGARTVELGRAFLEPELQNRGIGRELLSFAEEVFPETRRFVLDTPSWNLRTQHVYEKAGYRKIGEIDAAEGFPLIQYEKRIEK
ncbi:MAG TPA: GNAT family N-acetyltransferase [Gaiellaceae bacterium]